MSGRLTAAIGRVLCPMCNGSYKPGEAHACSAAGGGSWEDRWRQEIQRKEMERLLGEKRYSWPTPWDDYGQRQPWEIPPPVKDDPFGAKRALEDAIREMEISRARAGEGRKMPVGRAVTDAVFDALAVAAHRARESHAMIKIELEPKGITFIGIEADRIVEIILDWDTIKKSTEELTTLLCATILRVVKELDK